MAIAKRFNRCRPFGIANFLVALFQRIRLEALPRKASTQEIHKHMTECFQVVAPALFFAQMSADAHVPRGAGQALMFSIRDVLVRF